jgi:methylthioribose-1-phosphate isomerase
MLPRLTPETLCPIQYLKGEVMLLDQRLLPHKVTWVHIESSDAMISAIQTMMIRGAPALGVAGAFAIALGLKKIYASHKFKIDLEILGAHVIASRPTARNLAWGAHEVMMGIQGIDPNHRIEKAFSIAESVRVDDVKRCKTLSEFGSALCDDQENFLTICNAGALATAGYGSAVGVIRMCHEQGKKVHVWVSETRPRLQGVKLTALEMKTLGISHTIITDSMAATLMAQGSVTKVITGADRIAVNGDTANKIGTYSLAVLAKAHSIPFYIAAPWSTFDLACERGSGIPIEERSENEVLKIHNELISPEGAKAFNPAFDVTPAHLISSFITEKGILSPPFRSL